jgi:choline dehydrogenase-like flavoprotein
MRSNDPTYNYTWIIPSQEEVDAYRLFVDSSGASGDEFALDYSAIYLSPSTFVTHSSTCAMGLVVDNRLNVMGVNKLAVADMSILREPEGLTYGFVTAMTIGKIASRILRGVV